MCAGDMPDIKGLKGNLRYYSHIKNYNPSGCDGISLITHKLSNKKRNRKDLQMIPLYNINYMVGTISFQNQLNVIFLTLTVLQFFLFLNPIIILSVLKLCLKAKFPPAGKDYWSVYL